MKERCEKLEHDWKAAVLEAGVTTQNFNLLYAKYRALKSTNAELILISQDRDVQVAKVAELQHIIDNLDEVVRLRTSKPIIVTNHMNKDHTTIVSLDENNGRKICVKCNTPLPMSEFPIWEKQVRCRTSAKNVTRQNY